MESSASQCCQVRVLYGQNSDVLEPSESVGRQFCQVEVGQLQHSHLLQSVEGVALQGLDAGWEEQELHGLEPGESRRVDDLQKNKRDNKMPNIFLVFGGILGSGPNFPRLPEQLRWLYALINLLHRSPLPRRFYPTENWLSSMSFNSAIVQGLVFPS